MAFFECEYYSFATMSHRSFTAVIPLDMAVRWIVDAVR